MKRSNIYLFILISALCSSSRADHWPPTVENFVLDSETNILYENSEKEYLFATALQKKLKERTHKDFQIKSIVDVSTVPEKSVIVLGTQGSKILTETAQRYDKENFINQQKHKDGYKILFCSTKNNVAIIQGDDLRGLLYGIGRFLHSIRLDNNHFILPAKDLSDHPKSPVRLAWLATNLNNSLSVQSLERWDDLLLEYALWGANYIMTFYSPMYGNPQDPDTPKAERELWYKLPGIYDLAHKYLLTTVYHVHHNYIFPGKGRWSTGSHPNYEKIKAKPYMTTPWRELDHPKVCLSEEEGMELVYEKYNWILSSLKDKVDCINLHCMDWGGCGCEKCRPFAESYYKVASKHALQWKRINPQGQVMVDQTWLFPKYDPGSTDAKIFVNRLIQDKPGWMFATMVDNVQVSHSIPPAYIKTGMMYIGRYPYGVYGYQDAPLASFQKKYKSYLEHGVDGGLMIYTEGIQNNLGLAISLQFVWNHNPDLTESVMESYVHYYLGDENVGLKIRYIKDLNNFVSDYYGWLRKGELKKLHQKPYVTALIDRSQHLVRIANKLKSEMRSNENEWRWKLLYQSSKVWRNIAKLTEMESFRYSFENDTIQKPALNEALQKTWKEAKEQLIDEIQVIWKDVYEMPDALSNRTYIEGVLSDSYNSKILSNLLNL